MHLSYNLIIHVLSISALATAYPKARDRTSDLYTRDAYSEIYPQPPLEKRYIYPRAEIQPPRDPHPTSRLRRRKGSAPRPSPLTPLTPWPSGQNNPNPGPVPSDSIPLPRAGITNAFGTGRPVAPPPQSPRQPHNTEPATGNDFPPGRLHARPPPALISVSGRFPPTNVDHLSPFSDSYPPGLLSVSGALDDYTPPSRELYKPDFPDRGAANRSPRRRRSQILPPSRSPFHARSPVSAHSFQSGKVAFNPRTRLFTLQTHDAQPDSHVYHLRSRGVRSKKKSQSRNPSPGGSSSQDPSIPAAGSSGNADESSAALPLPPIHPPRPRTPSPPLLNPVNPPQSPDRLSVPDSPSISSPSPGSEQVSPTSVLPHERHRPNTPPFLPIDPELRNFILGGYARNAESPGSPRSTLEGAEQGRSPSSVESPRSPRSTLGGAERGISPSSSQSPPSSNGDVQTGRPSVRGRRSQFRPFTGSI